MNPEKTALLLIGFQNDYFAQDGILHSVIEASAKAMKTVEHTIELLEQLVDTPVCIISTPIFFTPNYEELTEPVGILKTIQEVGAFQQGKKGSEIIQELEPFKEHILEVPGKRGFNAFVNTNLAKILAERDIKHLVIAGSVTSICIDSTGRSANEQGLKVSILSDCTSARTNFEQQFYVEDVFPLYAETITAQAFLEQLSLVPSLC